jgi:hypothetical protein
MDSCSVICGEGDMEVISSEYRRGPPAVLGSHLPKLLGRIWWQHCERGETQFSQLTSVESSGAGRISLLILQSFVLFLSQYKPSLVLMHL